MSLKDYIQFQR